MPSRKTKAGTADPVAYDLPVATARAAYAQLAGVDPSLVAIGSQVSVFTGLVAANPPDGSVRRVHGVSLTGVAT
jgi:hypothetical protein